MDLLDYRRRVVRFGAMRQRQAGFTGLFQHGFGQRADVVAQAFDAAQQGGYGPGVQRLRAGGVGFGCAIADHAGDGFDGVAGAVQVLEM